MPPLPPGRGSTKPVFKCTICRRSCHGGAALANHVKTHPEASNFSLKKKSHTSKTRSLQKILRATPIMPKEFTFRNKLKAKQDQKEAQEMRKLRINRLQEQAEDDPASVLSYACRGEELKHEDQEEPGESGESECDEHEDESIWSNTPPPDESLMLGEIDSLDSFDLPCSSPKMFSDVVENGLLLAPSATDWAGLYCQLTSPAEQGPPPLPSDDLFSFMIESNTDRTSGAIEERGDMWVMNEVRVKPEEAPSQKMDDALTIPSFASDYVGGHASDEANSAGLDAGINEQCLTGKKIRGKNSSSIWFQKLYSILQRKSVLTQRGSRVSPHDSTLLAEQFDTIRWGPQEENGASCFIVDFKAGYSLGKNGANIFASSLTESIQRQLTDFGFSQITPAKLAPPPVWVKDLHKTLDRNVQLTFYHLKQSGWKCKLGSEQEFFNVPLFYPPRVGAKRISKNDLLGVDFFTNETDCLEFAREQLIACEDYMAIVGDEACTSAKFKTRYYTCAGLSKTMSFEEFSECSAQSIQMRSKRLKKSKSSASASKTN